MHAKLISTLLLLGVATACTSSPHMSADYGYSNQSNTRLHRVDPAAEGTPRPLASTDGQKMEQALIQYRKERVQQASTRDRVVVGLSGSSSNN